MKKIRLFKKVRCTRPTIYGWFVILIPVITVIILVFKSLDTFLSQNKPVESKILIVEGWLPDFAFPEIVKIFNENEYELLITTGGKITKGAMFTDFVTTAELAKASLILLGIDTTRIIALSRKEVQKDRTFHSALVVKSWLKQNNKHPETINLVSVGVHTRRSRYLFQKAFGKEISVGSICLNDIEYNQSKWWMSSRGFRQVLNETIAYIYAKLFFKAY